MRSVNLLYDPRIDQLRWFAATLVFLFHYALEWGSLGGAVIGNPWLGLITEGHTGVALFFTLSGFLFMRIAQHQQVIQYRAFLRNRVLRIAPLYLTIFLLATSLARDKFQPQDVLYLLSANLGNAPTSQSVVTGGVWAIPLEFTFYMVFPFLARFAMERGMSYLLGLIGLMVFFKVAAFTVNPNSTLMYFSTFVGRFDQFLIGMLAALFMARHGGALRRHADWLLPLAVLLVVGDSALQSHVSKFNVDPHSKFWIFWSLLESSGWACLILCWLSWGRQLPAWLDQLLCHGGKISYSFYLLHMAVIYIAAKAVGRAPVLTGYGWVDGVLCMLILYGATWALATLCFNVIEEPFLRMRRNYGTEKGAVVAAIDAKGNQSTGS